MFRFTIRDMLWLTVLVAVGVGWWLDRTAQRESVSRQMHAREWERQRNLTETHSLRVHIKYLEGNLDHARKLLKMVGIPKASSDEK